MKRIILPCWLFLFLVSCKQWFPERPLVKKEDYIKYLRPKADTAAPLRYIDQEMQFWKSRLNKNPDDIVSQSRIARLLGRRFVYSGDIHELTVADSLYTISNRFNRLGTAHGFRALAVNCISRRQFRKALLYIDSAITVGDEKYASLLVKFDVVMGLGDYAGANACLHALENNHDPAHLVRVAQYRERAERNLKEAITIMERALAAGRELGDRSFCSETGSYLADMYARDNRFKSSYQAYLDVLSDDPDYCEALEGIARLAFSIDRNTVAAEQILNNLLSRHSLPGYRFMLCRIAAYKKQETERQKQIAAFIHEAVNPEYGNMYNRNLFSAYADETNDAGHALQIAQAEISEHPIPESYQLLAWAQARNGNPDQAVQTVRAYPASYYNTGDACYYLGMIYKLQGDQFNTKKYLLQAMRHVYELDPLILNQIQYSLHATL